MSLNSKMPASRSFAGSRKRARPWGASVFLPAFLLAFLLAGSSPPAGAIVSEAYIDPAETPPSSCSLIYPENNRMCSGNIVGRDKFLTAGHCAPEAGETAIIQCQDQIGRLVKGIKTHPFYAGGSVSFDYALLQAESDFHLEPARLPKSSGAARALAERGECAVFGFGLNSAGGAGSLLGGPASAVINQSLGFDTAVFSGPAQIADGDSGGGLFCRKSAGGENSWILTAVISSIGETDETQISAAPLLSGNIAGWINKHLDEDLPLAPGFQPAPQIKTAPAESMESAEDCVLRLAEERACARGAGRESDLASKILRQCGLDMPQSHLKDLIEGGRADSASCAESIPESLAETFQSIRKKRIWEAGFCRRLAEDYESSLCGNCEKELASCLKSSVSEREAARQTLNDSASIFDLLTILFAGSGKDGPPYPPACITDFENSDLYAGIKKLCRLDQNFCSSEGNDYKNKALSAIGECAANEAERVCESRFHYCMSQAKDLIQETESIFENCAKAYAADRIYESKQAAYELPKIGAAACIERKIKALQMNFQPEASLYLTEMKTTAPINYYSLDRERCMEIITDAARQSRWLEERLPRAIDLSCKKRLGLRPDIAPDSFGKPMDYSACAGRLKAKGLAKEAIAKECVLRNFHWPFFERLKVFGLSEEGAAFLEKQDGSRLEKGQTYIVPSGGWVQIAGPAFIAEEEETCFLDENKIIKIAGFSADGRRALAELYAAGKRSGTACKKNERFFLPVKDLAGSDSASFFDRADAQLSELLNFAKRIIDPFLPIDY